MINRSREQGESSYRRHSRTYGAIAFEPHRKNGYSITMNLCTSSSASRLLVKHIRCESCVRSGLNDCSSSTPSMWQPSGRPWHVSLRAAFVFSSREQLQLLSQISDLINKVCCFHGVVHGWKTHNGETTVAVVGRVREMGRGWRGLRES